MKKREEVINLFMEKGFLISPDLIEGLPEEINLDLFNNIKNKIKTTEKPLVLSKDLFEAILNENEIEINWIDFEKSKSFLEKGRDKKIYTTFLDILNYNNSKEKKQEVEHMLKEIEEPNENIIIEKENGLNGNADNPILILKDYKESNKKREVQDFVGHLRSRYESLKKILLNRIELQNSISINRIKSNNTRENISLIGMISNKIKSKNGNIIFELEDPTGIVSAMVNKTKTDLFEIAEDIVLDEVIGVQGVSNNGMLFINNILFPDITDMIIKKSDSEGYAVFTSDIHLGLKEFLVDDFTNFIKWLNADYGSSEQKEISKKVKYLFIVGDLVEGVGVYPGQEKDLVIKDITKQYESLSNFLSSIPKNIKIIICAGNHDSVRIAEPQPIIDKVLAKSIYDLENITCVTNPCLINIDASRDFSGFNILLYHGFSIPYFAGEVSSIRINGGMDRTDLVLKFFLQRRHLAPTHTSNQYIPEMEQDPLLIDKVPDFFATGHIHKVSVSDYKGVTCLNCSSWASQTEENRRRGINPDPSKAILVNLKTRDIKILNFAK